jgi:hypothetical protein
MGADVALIEHPWSISDRSDLFQTTIVEAFLPPAMLYLLWFIIIPWVYNGFRSGPRTSK